MLWGIGVGSLLIMLYSMFVLTVRCCLSSVHWIYFSLRIENKKNGVGFFLAPVYEYMSSFFAISQCRVSFMSSSSLDEDACRPHESGCAPQHL